MGLFSRRERTPAAVFEPDELLDFEHGFPAAGVEHRTGDVRRALRDLGMDGTAPQEVTLEVRAEPTNAHDRRAIALLLAGRVVGYIPRRWQDAVRKQVEEAGRAGRRLGAMGTVLADGRGFEMRLSRPPHTPVVATVPNDSTASTVTLALESRTAVQLVDLETLNRALEHAGHPVGVDVEGLTLRLARDTGDPYDLDAVAVLLGETFVGHLAKSRRDVVVPRLKSAERSGSLLVVPGRVRVTPTKTVLYIESV